MNEKTRNGNDENRGDALSSLLRLAGPSAEIDRDVEKRVYSSVRQAWDEARPKAKPFRWAMPVALAASVLVAITVATFPRVDAPSSPQALGTVAALQAGSGPSAYPVGSEVFAGDVLDTAGMQGLSLALPQDVSLRIDADTVLQVDAADEFTLIAGRVYLDTGDRIYPDRKLFVHTAVGSASDVGTQFSVSFQRSAMNVAVRDGEVELNAGKQVHRAVRGDAVTVRPGESAEFDTLSPTAEAWNWAVALTPGFDIEDKSLLEFLKWVSRESGRELDIGSNELRLRVMQTKLHGPITGMSPLEALDAVLSTTRFAYAIDGRSITISQ